MWKAGLTLLIGLLWLAPATAVAATCAQISAQLVQLDTEKNQADGCSATVPKHTIPVPGQIVASSVCTPDAQALAAFMAAHQAQYDQLNHELIANGCTASCMPLPKLASPATDADGDGIADAQEAALIARFAPYLRFTVPPAAFSDHGADPYRPMDPLVYVQNAKLVQHNNGGTVYLPNPALKANPAAVLTNTGYGGASSDILQRYIQISCIQGGVGKEQYALQGLVTGVEKGADWGSVMATKHVGLFAHASPFHPGSSSDLPSLDPVKRYIGGTHVPVIPLSRYEDPSFAHNCNAAGETCYKIEYYQFFGANADFEPFGIGNHQADLSVITMVYDLTMDRIVAVSHWAHGYEMRFDLLAGGGYPNCPSSTDPLIGAIVTCSDANAGQTSFNILKISGTSAKQDQPEKAQNNRIIFFVDPVTHQPTHPVVYVEAGSHEFWPTAAWGAQGAPAHTGNDAAHHYLTRDIPNLGEIEYPMGDEAKIFIRYDGYWGNLYEINDVSPGPSLHASWNWFVPNRLPPSPAGTER